MKELLQKANKFIKEYGLDRSEYFWRFSELDKDSIMIHIPSQEVYSFELAKSKFGMDDFDDDNKKKVNVTNWSIEPDNKQNCFFYDKFFPVVNSTFDELVIKVDENLYATVVRDMVYDWDDLK